MTTFLFVVLEAWKVWCLPFELIPYGDPYLAALVLFSLCFYGFWRMAFGPSQAF